MATTLAIYVDLKWTTDEQGEEAFPPLRDTLTITESRYVRRTVDLADGVFVTLDIGNIVTPRIWVFLNMHATGDLIIGFGQVDMLHLPAGATFPGVVPSNLTAYAAGDGAASKLMYAVYA
jgi:hypothetical protein